MKKKASLGSIILTCLFSVVCLLWIMPIFEVLLNSFKTRTAVDLDVFALPTAETFAGLANYIKGLTFGDFPFLKSVGFTVYISVASTFLILLCCSMTAWYIVRVKSKFANLFYYLCLFSMIVPFQMVMFTLTSTASSMKLNTPWTIPVIYLGFGAGLAIFMFTGFVKGLPKDIEEAAAIDGCCAYLLWCGASHAEADTDQRGHSGADVGVERLPASLSCAGYHQVPHHFHSRAVPEGQLRYR